ncbi:KTSC domain-containing protein [Gluconobacter kondonii]|uniref:KTSC domain-containing protein n=1 Tax=Gluconobacter kondonii TaxID=941463 RepID=UPI001B8CF167|nr:KTSC domain-containing protein [Gluconobacter kondonii]
MSLFSHNFTESSSISNATYDDITHVLNITFRTGPRTYSYYGVPPAVWFEFTRASSAGRYFQQRIAPYYS